MACVFYFPSVRYKSINVNNKFLFFSFINNEMQFVIYELAFRIKFFVEGFDNKQNFIFRETSLRLRRRLIYLFFIHLTRFFFFFYRPSESYHAKNACILGENIKINRHVKCNRDLLSNTIHERYLSCAFIILLCSPCLLQV